MRIIAGTHRSRILLAPKDDTVTRPITDRVKQSLFDRLWSVGLITTDNPPGAGGGNVVDLFAGTGSLGLEALSRGSDHCVFVEQHRSARTLLERNIESLELGDRSTVLGVDALSPGWMTLITGHTPVRVVFCDPPYPLTRDPAQMARLAEMIAVLGSTPGFMEPGGILVLRTDADTPAPLVAGWQGPTSHRYGSMVVHFYEVGGES